MRVGFRSVHCIDTMEHKTLDLDIVLENDINTAIILSVT